MDDTPLDWKEIRRLYEETGTPTVHILRRFGLTPSALRHRRQSEAWVPRLPASGHRLAANSASRLRHRMLQLHGTLLGRLETWIAAESAYSAAQAEGLALLARSWAAIRQTEEREDSMAKPRNSSSVREKKNNDAGRDPAEDTTWLRAELKKRILRIRAAAGLGGSN